MESLMQNHYRRIRQVHEARSNGQLGKATHELISLIHDHMIGTKPSCECRISSDGFVTQVMIPCREHFWTENGGTFAETVFVVACAVISSFAMVFLEKYFG